MIARWLVAIGLVSLTGFGLIEFKRATVYRDSTDTVDEILAYEVTPTRGAAFELPAGLERVLVSAYGVLAAEVAAEKAIVAGAEAPLAYGFVALLTDAEGNACENRIYETVSRVQLDPLRGPPPLARLAYSHDLVSDPRTLAVDVRSCNRLGGRLELRASHGDVSRVLLRVSQTELRAPLERELMARRLGPEQRAELVEARASLGFADLPVAVQQRAVAGWRRRIGAIGQKDVDYVQRRLLLQRYRNSVVVGPTEELSIPLGPSRAAAINLAGPVTLRIAAEPGQVLSVSEGGRPPQPLRVPESGRIDVPLLGEDARTVEVSSNMPSSVRLHVDRDGRERLIGEPELLALPSEQFQVAPDLRRHRYLQLEREQPVVFRVPPGQPFFGISVRARLLDSLTLDGSLPLPAFMEGRLRARWDTGIEATTEVKLTPSRFDYFADDRFATERVTFMLRTPPGAKHLELYGDPVLTIAGWTMEPGVDEGELATPYRVELEEDVMWRNARYDRRPWAAVWPQNIETLQVADRVFDLVTQTRLERTGTEGELRPERAIMPENAILRRQLLSERPLLADMDLANAWTPFQGGRAKVNVPAEGSRAGMLEVVYRTSEEYLGEQLTLAVDGVAVAVEPLVLLSGRIQVPVSPGARQVELGGGGAQMLALAKVPPAGGRVVRAHTVFALTKSQPLTFVVDKRERQPLLLVLIVATEGLKPFQLAYEVDGGRPARQPGVFYQRTTEEQGVLAAAGGVDGRGLLWEAERSLSEARAMPDGIAKVRILLGDDLRPGRHTVKVRLLGLGDAGTSRSVESQKVWLRAVLVGSAPEQASDDTRWWSAEVMP